MDQSPDAYGRRRSSRSTKTGPGSRGGGYSRTPAYRRQWRLDHPEYRERESLRKANARKRVAEAKNAAVPSFTEALIDMLREEVERSSQRKVAHSLMVDHSTLSRQLSGDRQVPTGDLVDAIVAYFGIWAVVKGVQQRVRLARERANHGADPAGTESSLSLGPQTRAY